MDNAARPALSQTLARGLRAIEALADAEHPLTIAELSAQLQLHRSITYRIVRTLEDHHFVLRTASGALELGPRLAALARNVSRDLQAAALPELTAVANELGMTAFLAILDDSSDEVVTLASVEPKHATATVAERPGRRHPVGQGAPGRAIQSQTGGKGAASPYETSQDEVIPGLSSISVPLVVPDQRPAAIAVVYLSSRPIDVKATGIRLQRAAQVIVETIG